MEKRSWWQVDWQRIGIIVLVAIAIALFPIIYLWLFPPHELYCVVERNGEIVKAWDDDCRSASVM